MRRRGLEVGQLDVDHEAAHQARAHALVDRVELGRRHVGRHDHLAARVDERVEGVAELLLHGLALQELEIIDQQHVDGLELVLEGERVALAQRHRRN